MEQEEVLMASWEDIETYRDVMRLYEALDECDRSMCIAHLALSKIQCEERVKRFKDTWDDAYNELARILEYARV